MEGIQNDMEGEESLSREREMAEADLLYKITTLHILSKADYPISNKVLCEFFIDGGYTDYLNVQQAIGSLLDTGMMETVSDQSDMFRITDEGLSTLELFSERITDSIENDVKTFFEKKGMEMRRDSQLISDFYKSSGGGYYVHCRMSEEERNVMDLSFHVSDRAQAETICMNWKRKYYDVYAALMEQLM